jgi:hypothetical protein
MSAVEFQITRLPISLPCNVPVDPTTGNADLPLEQRSEKCATDAFWMVGAVPTCDSHLRLVCEITEIDYDGIWHEMGEEAPPPDATPWLERHRYSQAECRNLGES